MENRNTTDVLQSDLENNENVRWLYERFIEETQEAIVARLPDGLSAKVDSEALASTTLRQTIEHLKKNPVFRGSSLLFRTLRLDIAKKKVLNGIEAQFTQKRDAGREVDAANQPEIVSPRSGETEMDRAAMKESMRAAIAMLLDEDDQTRALINLLGLALELKPPDVSAILAMYPKKFKVLSLPTIRAQIEATRERIRKSLSDPSKEDED